MNPPQYSIDAYAVRLNMTTNRVLLVEGSSEKRMFGRMFQALSPYSQDRPSAAVIDTAAIIQSPCNSPIGNREKVERVCEAAAGNTASMRGKFVGFVDREFRLFDCDGNTIVDRLNEHRVDRLLVWSRGHSIENYFFDFCIWRRVVYSLVPNDLDDLDAALAVFRDVFCSVLALACTISLAARDAGVLGAVAGHVQWSVLRLLDKVMTVDIPAWRNHLEENAKLRKCSVQALIERYTYWEPVVKSSDHEAVRWMCHGHISESVIWAAFARCVYEACGRDYKKAQRAMESKESVRLCTCIEHWAAEVGKNGGTYPEPVAQMLEASTNGSVVDLQERSSSANQYSTNTA